MSFRIGLTHDLLDATGRPSFGEAPLQVLDGNPDIEWEYLPAGLTELTADICARYDGLYVNTPLVSAASVGRADCRVKIIARHGVGYDSVDVDALSARAILLTNTPAAVRRPVAIAAVTMITALAGRLFTKDRLVRNGAWQDRTLHMGVGLRGRVLTIVGAGSIGREVMRMVAPFEFELLAVDPVADEAELASLGAVRVSLDEGLTRADFVLITCLLNEQTHHLVSGAQLARMKPQAFLINLARGPVVDETALIEALRTGQIAGAGLDVFEREPIDPANPLIAMDNVILTPHALCWTDQCFHDIATDGLTSLVDFSMGRRPRYVVNG